MSLTKLSSLQAHACSRCSRLCASAIWGISGVCLKDGPVLAQGWASLPTHKSIYESIEIAEREARAQFEWLA